MIAPAKANYFEEQFEKLKDENLRIGLILCNHKNNTFIRINGQKKK